MLSHCRIILLCLLTLLPALTIFHKNELDRWTLNRCAMAAPDELSYMLMAQNMASGHSPSIRYQANSETFYPLGFPMILAIWAIGVNALGLLGTSVESFHICDSLLLCSTVPILYLLIQALLKQVIILRRSKPTTYKSWLNTETFKWIALVITALYVTNWYVLETALFVFSEPAFMLFSFLWLLTAIRIPDWYERVTTTLLMAILALAANSIRGAGIICVATTLLYPLLVAAGRWRRRKEIGHVWIRPIFACGVVIVALCYNALIMSQLMPKSEGAYSGQLTRGLTNRGVFVTQVHKQGVSFQLATSWGSYITQRGITHLQNWTEGFIPPYRGDPYRGSVIDFISHFFELMHTDPSSEEFRATLYDIIAKILIVISFCGFASRIWRGRTAVTRLPELYVALYAGLYILWPFDMTRFWVPIYPLMLFYSAVALSGFRASISARRMSAIGAGALSGLLLVLFAEEMVLKLPYYQRRLNYVSDVLADTASFVRKDGQRGDLIRVVVGGGDESKTMAWFLKLPTWPGMEGPKGVERQLLQQMEYVENHPGTHLYGWSYFAHDDWINTFANLHEMRPDLISAFDEKSSDYSAQPLHDHWIVRKKYQQWNISAVWELVPPNTTEAASQPNATVSVH